MHVAVLVEEGYEMALRGMAYSFKDRAVPVLGWWDTHQVKAEKRAELLAGKEGGHNKFLESIIVWIDIEACRAFWSEFDTYRVGTTKQSESTMHTLQKRPPEYADFEADTPWQLIEAFQDIWPSIKNDVTTLKCALPEGYLQRRLVCTNYKVVRNIVAQREGHRLKYWDRFIQDLIDQLEHPEFLK